MRHLIMIGALLLSTVIFAQKTQNTTKETVITKKTITDHKGTRTSTERASQTKSQKMRLDEQDANKINQSVVMEPVEVDTNVSYEFEGNYFQFLNEENRDGYRLMTIRDNVADKEYAIIKPSSQDGYYIISREGKSSFGYFNAEGNFVVERYDEKTGKVISDVYHLQESSLKRD